MKLKRVSNLLILTIFTFCVTTQAADSIVLQSSTLNEFLEKKPLLSEDTNIMVTILKNNSELHKFKFPAEKHPWSGFMWHGSKGLLNRTVNPQEKSVAVKHDSSSSLKKNLYASTAHYLKSYKTMPSWVGLCDGWSIAGHLIPRPVNTVSYQSSDGALNWYSGEIKGLASQLFGMAFTHEIKKYVLAYRPQTPMDLLNMLIVRLKQDQKPVIGELEGGEAVQNHNIVGYSIDFIPYKRDVKKESVERMSIIPNEILRLTLHFLRNREIKSQLLYANVSSHDNDLEDIVSTKVIDIGLKFQNTDSGKIYSEMFFIGNINMPYYWTIDSRLLGMRSYFEGNINHLPITLSSEIDLELLRSLVLKSKRDN
jgi:hypothetical protein